LTSAEVKTLLLVKWNKLRILAQKGKHDFLLKAKKTKPFFVSSAQIQSATSVLDFIDTIPDLPVSISKMGRHHALPADFEGVPFQKFLYLDNLFQGYLQTQKDDFTAKLRSAACLQVPGFHPLFGIFFQIFSGQASK
jgi:hypothetical protein